MKEFSKWFIRVAVFTWIVGALFGAGIIVVELYVAIVKEFSPISIDLTGYLMYIATPLTGGVLGYMGKAAFENKEKIKQNFSFRKAYGYDRPDTDNEYGSNAGFTGDNGGSDSADSGEADRGAEREADHVG